VHASISRGNNYKLVPEHCRYDLREYYLTNRVDPIWNSLPNDLVMADNIDAFKKRLDKFWLSYDFVGHTKSRQEPSGAVRIPSGKPPGTNRNRENYMND